MRRPSKKFPPLGLQRRFCGTNTAATASPSRIRPLKEALSYRNVAVIRKFQEAYAVSDRAAAELFRETKRWLWLNARANLDPKAPRLFVETDGIVAIDQMWHTFVLFTKEYADFCHRYLGHFVHHVPTTYREVRAHQRGLRRSPAYARKERLRLEAVVQYVFDELGEETMLRWFRDYQRRFSLAHLDSRRRTLQAGACDGKV